MTGFVPYFFIQLKRIGKQLPFIVFISLALVLALSTIGWAFQQNSGKVGSKDASVVNIALVGNPDQSYLGIGVVALTQLDSSSYAINYMTMYSEEEAKRALAMGEITGYVLIPDGYVEAMSRGENMPLTYASCNDNFGIGAVLMKELILTISDLMLESQASIYAGGSVAQAYLGRNAFGPATDELFVYEIDAILNREHLFEITNVGISKGLGVVPYYGVAITVLLLLLFGTTCGTYFANRSQPLCRLLWSKGTGVAAQILAEFLPFLISMVVTMLVLCPAIQLVVNRFELAMPSVVMFLLKLLPGMSALAAWSFLLYELVVDLVPGVFLQFLSALALGFVSGCFYPVSFLPRSLQVIGSFTPSGMLLDYGSAILLGEGVGVLTIKLIACTVLCLGLSVWIRRLRLQR